MENINEFYTFWVMRGRESMPMFDIPEEIDEIKIKKDINDFMRKIQEETKPEKCILCGKEQTSFCNSHSVPKMVLKNIAKAGKLYHANKLIEIPVVDKEKGISNSGTFYFICWDCDSKLFQEYENVDAFLCNYAHCNFSIINEFIDDGQFSCDKSDNIYMAKVMTLFVYIKLFESIVTVEGEDFLNSREEKECYKLVRESTKFIYDRLEEFSKYNCKTASDELNRHMRNMFKNMRSSLKEEVGSIKKDFL